jgi:hypothetical protein
MELFRSLFNKAAVVKADAAEFLRWNGDITFFLVILVSLFGVIVCKLL